MPRPSGATREASLSYPQAFRKSKCQKIRFFDSVLYNPPFVGTIQRVRNKRVNPRGMTARPTKEETSMSSLKPLADRVLVKPDEAEQKTASGLYIASNAQEKPQRGTIVAVGAGKVNDKGERIPMDVKVGDVVIYGKFGGNEVKVDGEKYLLMRADDIYAVVEA